MLSHVLSAAGSVSSQVTADTSTRRHQSRHAGNGDGVDTAVMTTSSTSTWQQLVTSLRSAVYFCLITCPAGRSCCTVYIVHFYYFNQRKFL